MNASSSFLEDFSQPSAAEPSVAPQATPTINAADAEQAYEKGYRAGWDDAVGEARKDANHVSEALARRLQEITMTRDDVNAQVLTSLEPLLREVFEKLLPQTASWSFLPILLEEARAMLAAAVAEPLTILASEEDVTAIEALVAQTPDLTGTNVIAEPALGLSQARLQMGDVRCEVNLGAVLDSLEGALDQFTPNEQERLHG